jgi:hypothetical protein
MHIIKAPIKHPKMIFLLSDLNPFSLNVKLNILSHSMFCQENIGLISGLINLKRYEFKNELGISYLELDVFNTLPFASAITLISIGIILLSDAVPLERKINK